MARLTRREFSCAIAAAAALAPATRASAAMDPVVRRGAPRMKLSLAAYSFRSYLTDYRRGQAARPDAMTLDGFVDLCAEYPLDGVELTSYYVPEPLPDAYLQRLRRRAFLLGLTVSGTAIGNTFTHPPGPRRASGASTPSPRRARTRPLAGSSSRSKTTAAS